MLSDRRERTQRSRPRPGGNDLTAKPTPAAALGPLPSPRTIVSLTDTNVSARHSKAEPEGLTSESSRHSLTPKSCQRPHGPLGCTHRISDRHALDGWDHQPSTRAWLPVVSTGEGGLLLQVEPRCPQLAVRLSPGGGWRERLDYESVTPGHSLASRSTHRRLEVEVQVLMLD